MAIDRWSPFREPRAPREEVAPPAAPPEAAAVFPGAPR
jgi:hypothetical protein